MISRLIRVTVVVRDYDEALRFYTEQLGFVKRADMAFGPGMRWLTVAPPQQHDLEIVLQQPTPAMHGEERAREMEALIGKQPTSVFETADCHAEYAALSARGVTFSQAPQQEQYGVEAVFQDLYGNSYSLLQPAATPDQFPDSVVSNDVEVGVAPAEL